MGAPCSRWLPRRVPCMQMRRAASWAQCRKDECSRKVLMKRRVIHASALVSPFTDPAQCGALPPPPGTRARTPRDLRLRPSHRKHQNTTDQHSSIASGPLTARVLPSFFVRDSVVHKRTPRLIDPTHPVVSRNRNNHFLELLRRETDSPLSVLHRSERQLKLLQQALVSGFGATSPRAPQAPRIPSGRRRFRQRSLRSWAVRCGPSWGLLHHLRFASQCHPRPPAGDESMSVCRSQR